jgi:hypothetical protein
VTWATPPPLVVTVTAWLLLPNQAPAAGAVMVMGARQAVLV